MKMNMSEKIKVTKQDLVRSCVLSTFLLAGWNFERMQAMGFCHSLLPIIKRLYKGKPEEIVKALKRHLVFYNTTPFISNAILGITIAMEEERANGAEIDDNTINAVKVGLIGPLAGVGDPLIWGTLRPMIAAVGASMAITGNVIGPILFFVIYNVIRITLMWFALKIGYQKGVNILEDLKGNMLEKLTEGASILGLFVIGALITKWTHIDIPIIVSEFVKQDGTMAITTVQSILDQLAPGLVSLLLTFLCMKILKKGVSPIAVIFGMFAFGIIGSALGILQ
ncbi:PTS system mannose/fructose/sorbose family transporter subunit IID [Pectinatus frisingensis]|uniref:PTS system mannose/fructose/sorbose family transporter subunit IID n=1 Tax=Pectinatus frisingensis TaxID=865 RepID=UPI002ED7DA38